MDLSLGIEDNDNIVHNSVFVGKQSGYKYEKKEKKKIYIDAYHTFDYTVITTKHNTEWNNRDILNREKSLKMLDDQLADYRNHPLASNTNVIIGGGGDSKPDVVFVTYAQFTKDNTSDRDGSWFTFSGIHGQVLRDNIDTLLKKEIKCYFLHLLPFYVSDFTHSTESAEQYAKKYVPHPKDYQIFLDYAKKRVDVLCPKVAVCLGVDALRAVCSNFDCKAMNVGSDWSLMKKFDAKSIFLGMPNRAQCLIVPSMNPYRFKIVYENSGTVEGGLIKYTRQEEHVVNTWFSSFKRAMDHITKPVVLLNGIGLVMEGALSYIEEEKKKKKKKEKAKAVAKRKIPGEKKVDKRQKTLNFVKL